MNLMPNICFHILLSERPKNVLFQILGSHYMLQPTFVQKMEGMDPYVQQHYN
jgi:hypothetical protein